MRKFPVSARAASPWQGFCGRPQLHADLNTIDELAREFLAKLDIYSP